MPPNGGSFPPAARLPRPCLVRRRLDGGERGRRADRERQVVGSRA
ncbi:hypothetical protein [Streptomyces sp. NPDC050856]